MSTLRALLSNQLVAMCLESGTPDCWEEFVRRFQPPIALAVMRAAKDWQVISAGRIEDFVQEVFVKLCADDFRLLRVFVPQEPDSVIGYLKVLAANTTRDLLRAQTAKKRGGDVFFIQEENVLDNLAVKSKDRFSNAEWLVQLREIEEALRSFIPEVLTERDRSIFWLYFRHGFTARDISEMRSLGLSEKGVESSIYRTTRELRTALNRGPDGGTKGFTGPFAILKEER